MKKRKNKFYSLSFILPLTIIFIFLILIFINSISQNHKINLNLNGEFPSLKPASLKSGDYPSENYCEGKNCDDNNPCTTDSCNEDTGGCVYKNNPTGSRCYLRTEEHWYGDKDIYGYCDSGSCKESCEEAFGSGFENCGSGCCASGACCKSGDWAVCCNKDETCEGVSGYPWCKPKPKTCEEKNMKSCSATWRIIFHPYSIVICCPKDSECGVYEAYNDDGSLRARVPFCGKPKGEKCEEDETLCYTSKAKGDEDYGRDKSSESYQSEDYIAILCCGPDEECVTVLDKDGKETEGKVCSKKECGKNEKLCEGQAINSYQKICCKKEEKCSVHPNGFPKCG